MILVWSLNSNFFFFKNRCGFKRFQHIFIFQMQKEMFMRMKEERGRVREKKIGMERWEAWESWMIVKSKDRVHHICLVNFYSPPDRWNTSLGLDKEVNTGCQAFMFSQYIIFGFFPQNCVLVVIHSPYVLVVLYDLISDIFMMKPYLI